MFGIRRKSPAKTSPESLPETAAPAFGTGTVSASAPQPAPLTAEQPRSSGGGFFQRLRQKLNRGNSWLTYDLANLIPGGKIDEDVLEELETRLILADVGVETTEKILGSLRGQVARNELADLQALLKALRESLLRILAPCEQPLVLDRNARSGIATGVPVGNPSSGMQLASAGLRSASTLTVANSPSKAQPAPAAGPFVILVVGVNGAGKTTTIGKLAHRFVQQRLKVMLAAGDTFRAAAVEQLQIWGERNSVAVVAQAEGADPAAVVFDALQSAQARVVDVLLADTAGRLHTQSNLMAELKKIKRVMTRLDPTAPHEVLLVLDAGQGQNALQQAQLFNEALGVTGLVLTKLDGTAKGGIVFAIADRLKLPIRYIGVGESAEDFEEFKAASFVDALLNPSNTTSTRST